MTYTLEQIKKWALEGHAINAKVALELIEVIEKLETE